MKRKMTDLAFGLRWASLGARGLRTPSSARSSCCSRIPASAIEPKPQNASWMNSRRVRVGRQWFSLLNIDECIQVEDGQGELLQRMPLQERGAEALLFGRRRAARRQPEGQGDLGRLVGARFPAQPLREGLGQRV